jgi:hypothetical protein
LFFRMLPADHKKPLSQAVGAIYTGSTAFVTLILTRQGMPRVC